MLRRFLLRWSFALLLAGITLAASASVCAQETQRKVVDEIGKSLSRAGELLRGGKADEAAAALAEGQTAYQTLASGDVPAELAPQVKRLGERVAAAERLITKAQQPPAKPVAAKKPAAPTATAAKTTKPAKGKKPGKPAAPAFTAEIAPILIARCGACHVRGARGGLSMATFASLEKGNESGPVFRVGSSGGSRLIEVILSGDMPRGGGKLTPEEFAKLTSWIDAGALFDGSDRDAPIGQATKDTQPEGLVKATGQESVQFVRDLAPVLLEHCRRCHGGDQPGGQFRMETFAELLKGGTSGVPIEPGKPADSLLVKRLRGIDGDQMPQDKPPLPEETIKRFETWIQEGATYDGSDATLPMRVAVEELAAGRLSHEDLTAKRLAQAEKIWQLGLPDEVVAQAQTPSFIVLGNVTAARLQDVADMAEAERAKMARLLKLDADGPLVKGSLVLFVFRRSFDYGEFVRMVEGHEAPRGQVGHARTRGSDAYACLVVQPDADPILPALVAEQVAAGYLQTRSGVPSWFAQGAGRAIASRLEPKNSLVKQWDGEISKLAPADGFFTATVLDADAAAQTYSFARWLLLKLPKFQALASSIAAGRDFNQAVEEVYRMNARLLVETWLRQKK